MAARLLWLGAVPGFLALGQTPIPFADKLYPVLTKAGCQMCHNPDGVASATRLRFPEEDAPKQRIDAFGKSLVELVDRQNPDKSILFNKPTNRVTHTGGERIKKGSPEETLLTQWINYLASLPEAQVQAALRYSKTDSANAVAAPTVVLRRLTHQQYANTVRDLMKESSDAASQFPPEDFVNGFKNQYESQSLSPTQVEAYSLSAERLANNAFRRGDVRHLIPCDYSGANQAQCRTQFIQIFGRRAFRRPLLPKEMALYEGLFKAERDFLKGAQSVIEGMLQSPSFLFWMERTSRPEWKPYTAATRLSYFLWNTMPDDSILDSAAKGELNTPEGVDRIARKMLGDVRAREALDEFASQWLRFDRAFAAARERRTFPQFSRELVQSMAEESRRFVGDLVWNDRNFMDIYRASYGFVNSDLASIYGVPAPERDFDRVAFPPEQQRAGVLGQGLFLTLTSKPEDTAPTGRGLFIREQFLCQQVPPPPAGVDTNLQPVSELRPVTNRERMSEHASNKVCASCHGLIDPIGFALENFDAIGVRRDKFRILFYPDVHEAKIPKKEVNLDLDTTGQVAGLPNGEFNGPRQLGEALAGAEQCQECIVKQLFRYMTGRRETPADNPLIRQALEDFKNSGFHLKELLVSLSKSWDTAPRERTLNAERYNQTR